MIDVLIKMAARLFQSVKNNFLRIITPILSLIIIYSMFCILAINKYQLGILKYIILICICVTMIEWLMAARIKKDNKIKTNLLKSEQQEKLYELNIIQCNQQIEKISKIKHDMNNNILCINELISNKEYDEAKNLCNVLSERFMGVYTPINTNNLLLNAAINIELEKAANSDIVFTVIVNDEIPEFSKNSDIVTIISNICDNSIEYLQHCIMDMREMVLEITRYKGYCIISCKNRINSSVLSKNPNLATNKQEKSMHGKGMGILRNCVEKYDGYLKCYEQDGFFYSSVVVRVQNLPENI